MMTANQAPTCNKQISLIGQWITVLKIMTNFYPPFPNIFYQKKEIMKSYVQTSPLHVFLKIFKNLLCVSCHFDSLSNVEFLFTFYASFEKETINNNIQCHCPNVKRQHTLIGSGSKSRQIEHCAGGTLWINRKHYNFLGPFMTMTNSRLQKLSGH